jgi:5-methylcytosine-specific restriction endonuclease McrA
LLRPHLTAENYVAVLDRARHKCKRDIEHLIVQLQPKPEVPSFVRKLPTPAVKPEAAPVTCHSLLSVGEREAAEPESRMQLPSPRRNGSTVGSPITPERYKVQFTIEREVYDRFRRAQDLLRHTIPTGDPAEIFDKALTLLLKSLEKHKLATTDRPRSQRRSSSGSRHIPAAVKRAVWERDGGCCACVGTNGRCTERGFLEFHHIVPFAANGDATIENMELRCRAHNLYEADIFFGTRRPSVVREVSPTY